MSHRFIAASRRDVSASGAGRVVQAARAGNVPAASTRAASRSAPAACACGGTCPRCVSPSAGQPIPAALAGRLGARLGGDLSGVRVHTGAEAAHAVAQAGARRAFARDEQIVIGDPQFSPHSATGQRLLAHEATHVLQQRGGHARAADSQALEREAGHAAEAFAHGRAMAPVRQGTAPAGAVQRDEPTSGAPSLAPTLQLDPEIQAQMFMAQWLATHGSGASAADAGGAAVTDVPLPSDWLGPSRLGAETLDYGSLITPYYDRGLMPAGHADTRDHEVISRLFGDRYRLVLNLPDLRAAAPGFVRPLIPTNWRVQLAATLTSTTIDWSLSRDNPTFFDLSNQTWERFTGASTISLPMLPVPFVNDWWNRISGGGR